MIAEELGLLRLHVGGDRREDELLRGAVRQVREIPSVTIPRQLLKISFIELFNIKIKIVNYSNALLLHVQLGQASVNPQTCA